jgi:DNA (cytosine-5)-methyltransferase 1
VATVTEEAGPGVVVDLFTGGGGAAVGYWLAGFEVVGLDIAPQPRYPFEFHLGDATDPGVVEQQLENVTRRWPGSFVIVTASPPCQRFSVMTPAALRDGHPDLIDGTRRLLASLVDVGLASAWVMENVPGAPMPGAVTICGQGLGLAVRRHRLFESSEALWGVPCAHGSGRVPSVVGGYGGPGDRYVTAAEGRAAMGMPWLPWPALVQSVPPAYTEFLGRQLAERFGIAGPERTLEDLRPRCACGAELAPCVTGRWPLHCRQACRQRAYRRRRASVSLEAEASRMPLVDGDSLRIPIGA